MKKNLKNLRSRIIWKLSRDGKLDKMNDKKYLKLLYWANFHKKLNLKNPITFTEKLQWLKLNDRNPKYTFLVDKYKVKEYIKNQIGDEYVIPLIGVWDSFEQINFDDLPSQFVLKTNHGCGGLVICKNKSELNYEKAKIIIDQALTKNYFYKCREWPYKNVERKIIAEEYMEDTLYKELRDYKFLCFNGKVEYMFIASDREKNLYFDYFDRDFNHINYREFDNAPVCPSKPLNYDLMIELSEKLSKGMPHVRLDWYEVNGKLYFGEFTFYTAGGTEKCDPESWDKVFGDLIDLNLAYGNKKLK